MYKFIRVTFLCALALGVIGLFQHADAYSVVYEQTVRIQGRTELTKVFVKDRNFRIEGTSEGKVTIIINNTQGLFGFVPSEHAAVKISNPGSSLNLVSHTYDFMGYLKMQNARIVDTQTINGVVCDVYQFQDPSTRKMTKAWVCKKMQFPIKIEITSQTGLIVIEAQNIQFDVSLSDGLFTLPAGVEVMDMSTSPDVMRIMENIR